MSDQPVSLAAWQGPRAHAFSLALSLLVAGLSQEQVRAADMVLDLAHSTPASLVRLTGEIRRGESYPPLELRRRVFQSLLMADCI